MKIFEPFLFDTNVLVYNQDRDSLFYNKAASYHQKAIFGEIKTVIATQNLLEFAAVMVNSKKITRPLSQKQTAKEINKYLESACFKIIYPNEKTLNYFIKLLKKYLFKNPKQIFDLFLVATMITNKVKYILTANEQDFQFKEIKVIKL